MNRRFLFFVHSPALLLGLVLVGVCALTMWSLHALHEGLIEGVERKLVCLAAAHDMEVAVRQLRYDLLLSHAGPSDERQRPVELDYAEFEAALAEAKAVAPADQQRLVATIETAYDQYRAELDGETSRTPSRSTADLIEWATAHPIQRVAEACQALLRANQLVINRTIHETQSSGRQLELALLLLGALGPLGGILFGFSIARTLRRSIAGLRVSVQDVHSHLAPVVQMIDVPADSDLDSLQSEMQVIVERVQGLVERHQAQQLEILRSEQLAAIGKLASSLAHEIRNPLTAMRWLVESAIEAYDREPVSLGDLNVVQSEIERMGHTVQGILDFARPSPPRRVACDLRGIVHESAELIRVNRKRLGVACDVELPEVPAAANVDPARIKSVLLNLLLNALDAMPHGGHLRILLVLQDERVVEIAIEDTGKGIDEEVLPNLFSPFTTTKETGTGLGLSVSKHFVEEHGGTLSAENRPEGGARFVVTLPLAPERILESACPTQEC
ncbi:Sporulation kinase A [Planctomycetes bacterium Pan216]|uniref:histidine kinase n=1 Tax=Kolteria novifilia TaxID=2527975 RepID=A0A518BAL8_9BACT|nr:Sporulation kinase A [Planctomycetes bacterium Pan216]